MFINIYKYKYLKKYISRIKYIFLFNNYYLMFINIYKYLKNIYPE